MQKTLILLMTFSSVFEVVWILKSKNFFS